MSRSPLLLILSLAACGGGRTVNVRVSVTGPDSAESPVPGVVLTAIPFNRDSVLAALEHRAGTPRPGTAELDSLLARYRGPFATLAEAGHRAAALRDSVAQGGRDTLRLRTALAAADSAVASARRDVDRVRTGSDARVDSLRRGIARWENSTYADYESVATARLKAARQEAVTDTTGADGWAHLRLGTGAWWVYATSWDVDDPNRYWYWNVAVDGDTLRLDSRRGVRRTRY